MGNKFENIEKKIKELGFRINSKDFNRPWGGFLVIDETQSNKFIEYFFENLDMSLITKGSVSYTHLTLPTNREV